MMTECTGHINQRTGVITIGEHISSKQGELRWYGGAYWLEGTAQTKMARVIAIALHWTNYQDVCHSDRKAQDIYRYGMLMNSRMLDKIQRHIFDAMLSQ